MTHPIRCRCGALTGRLSHPGNAHRGVCYCRDCQGYARFLGTGDILDDQGGTDVAATLQKHVSFDHGIENLACISLTPNGLLRWYAPCCDTPIGNTTRDFRMSYVGLVHSCLHDSSASMDSVFGPVRMRVNTRSAKGHVQATPFGTLAAVLGLSTSLIRARLDGSYRRTPFFDPVHGTPVAAPKVLSTGERERAMQAE